MPELPEVETVRRGLLPVMEGAVIQRVTAKRPDLRFPLPEGLAERLEGTRIEALSRRAKYLLAETSAGLVLAMHLGMSGSFRIEADGTNEVPGEFLYPRSENRLHDHVRFDLTHPDRPNASVVFNDPRRFGYMTLIERAALADHPHFRALGIEPTGNALSGAALAPRFAGRAAPLKAVLLDQSVIAGLGNIYVCEALWRARIDPRKPGAKVSRRAGWVTSRSTFARRLPTRSGPAAPPCATTGRSMATSAISSIVSPSMAGRTSLACARPVAASSNASSSRGARPSSVPSASAEPHAPSWRLE